MRHELRLEKGTGLGLTEWAVGRSHRPEALKDRATLASRGHRLARSKAALESGGTVPQLPWGLQRASVSHRHRLKQSISTMSWFWLHRWLLCGRIFLTRSLTFYCPCCKTFFFKKAKINFQSSKWQTVTRANVLFLPMLVCLPSDLILTWWASASSTPIFSFLHLPIPGHMRFSSASLWSKD